jgi:hypothetical protein
MALECMIVWNGHRFEAEARVVLYGDYCRPHREKLSEKPVIVTIDVNRQDANSLKVRGETRNAVERDELLTNFNALGEERAGEPHSLRLTVDQQFCKILEPDAVVLGRMKSELHKGARTSADKPRQDPGLVGLCRATAQIASAVIQVAQRS